MDWFALYTKPHNEIKVAEKLLSMGIEAYCPTIVVEKQWSDRKKKIQQPPLYSFVFLLFFVGESALVFGIPVFVL